MYVMHIALGGCIEQPPISHDPAPHAEGRIAHVLGAAAAQARLPGVSRVDILTRLIRDPAPGPGHDVPLQQIGPKLRILRLKGPTDARPEKEASEADLPALAEAFLDLLAHLPRKPDILHCHGADAAELGLAARARFHVPMLYTPHLPGTGTQGRATGEANAAIGRERRAIAGADAIIAASQDEAERQVAALDPDSAGRVWRINPGISLPLSSGDEAAARMLGSGLDRPGLPFLLAVARPGERLNLAGLMQAFLSSADLRTRANLVILSCGDKAGPDRRGVLAELATMAKAAPGKVLLAPCHDAALVPQFYRRAVLQGGLLVSPALHETFCPSLVEAACFGLPVAAARHGASVDILGAIGHGLPVDPQSQTGIAAACLRLLGDPDEWKRRSQNALANHQWFDWDAWAERVFLVCRRLTRKSAPLRPGPLPRTVLAFDIDGTLTGCPKSAPAFARWIAGTRGRRQHAMIATGRSLPEARRILADWSIPEPAVMITSVGSEIWRTNRRGALALCPDYAAWIGRDWQPEAIRRLLSGMAVVWQAPHDQRRWKISLFGSEADAWAIQDALTDAQLAARVIPSHGRFIDILPQRAGKVGALSFEARRLGLTLADCVAAGDSGNDACMLAAAGRAIVVGNAWAELRLADRPGLYRATAAHAAGVLEGLAHFGLSDARPAEVVPAE
ncbi:HAD-IIB family hydrolase [Paracoccus fontiphilus]|uniref:sucrose-phosphate synthase n=1 Tax=Paracoccus fontiphilus TaxID=1815556 RepID=A0ABV7IE46_9RHOB|nr:HAD-IIB family hydrolase [Paracoccus fontiphilus]